MQQRRPHPFRSVEGCFLSRTMGAIIFLTGFGIGALVGYVLGDVFGYRPDEGARWGAALGAVLLGWTPWRRWVVRAIKEREARDREDGTAV